MRCGMNAVGTVATGFGFAFSPSAGFGAERGELVGQKRADRGNGCLWRGGLRADLVTQSGDRAGQGDHRPCLVWNVRQGADATEWQFRGLQQNRRGRGRQLAMKIQRVGDTAFLAGRNTLGAIVWVETTRCACVYYSS